MAETKKEIREQLKYMLNNQLSYYDKNNPKRISEAEFWRRIEILRQMLKEQRRF